jgi:predicted nucleotidyltransferase
MDNIIKSFTVRASLYSDIWDNASSDDFKTIKLHKDVREHLISIAKDFIESFGIDSFVIEDILFVGSLANYNWSEYSDVDLHIVIDKEKVNDDTELVDEFFTAKKEVYNLKHNIKVKGFDVELYVQDIKEEFDASDGIYSILYNKWRKEPSKDKSPVNKSDIIKKVKEFVKKLSDIKKEEEPDAKLLKLKKLKEKIKAYRKSGLNATGEYSTENLVFKYLRRSGYMDELADLGVDIKDEFLSLENEEY